MRKTLNQVLILVLVTGPLGCASGGIKTLPVGSAEAQKHLEELVRGGCQ